MRKEHNHFNLWQRFGSLLLAAVLILGMLPTTGSATNGATPPVNVTTVADSSTAMSYEDMLGTGADGNRYAGRVWTDKSVYNTGSVTLDGVTVSDADDNFIVVYSALGSTTSLSANYTKGAVDVVVVLDNSASMANTVDDGGTRMASVIASSNELLKELTALPDARVAVVTYSQHSDVLLPLDYYVQVGSTTESTDDDVDFLTVANISSMNSGGQTTARAMAVSYNSDGTAVHTLVSNTNSGYQRGTNQHAGIDAGLKLLASEANTDGRTPVLIVMTDGVADTSASKQWYDYSESNYLHPADNAVSAGVILGTLLNAAYNVQRVENNYGINPTVYTIGVDVDDYISAGAEVILNPAEWFAASPAESNSYAATAWTWYQSWLSGAPISKSETVTGGPGGSKKASWTFDAIPSGSGVTVQDIQDNIYYTDSYTSVENANLTAEFQKIVEEIRQDAFFPITDTTTSGGHVESVPLTYVDFIGDYMEVKDIKLVSIFGKTYPVTKGTTTDGVTTYIVGNGETVTHPVLGTTFNISEAITMELKQFQEGDACPTQQLWIYVAEEALPTLYDQVVDSDGEITFIEETAEPLRVFYTVDLSDYVLDEEGQIKPYLIDEAYVEEYGYTFYTNRFNEMSTTDEAGNLKGDAHASFMASTSNRYYYHQDNHDIFISATNNDATQSEISWNAEEYGVLYSESAYLTTHMTYADVADLEDADQVYTFVSFYRPTENTTDGDAGEKVKYLIYTKWSELKGDVAYYDTVNKVWINGQSDSGFVTSTEYGVAVDSAVIDAYITATGVSADKLEAHLGIGSWRVSRLTNMLEEKVANETDTANIAYAPTFNTNPTHVGSIVVWLGNNGKLTLNYDPRTPSKTVSNITTGVTDADGKTVMVGEILEYTIHAENYNSSAATITITDTVPAGTEFVSAANGGVHSNGTVTWTVENVAPGAEVTVSFQVRVTEAALDNAVVTSAIQNTAAVQLNNGPVINTNTTSNPPSGKKVTIQGENQGSTVQVGDLLEYAIEYHNDTGAVAQVVVTDVLPAGTTFISADHGGAYDAATHTVTWTFENVQPGAGGVVTFTVQVDASAVTPIENGATIDIGNNSYTTNKTSTELDTGKLVLTKEVNAPTWYDENDAIYSKQFTLTLTDPTGKLNGTYSGVAFVNGVATVEIKHGQTITVEGLPAGVTILVSEASYPGFTTAITGSGQAVIPANGSAAVDVTNTYSVSNLEVLLQGDKELQGGSPDNETFGFTVVPCDASGNPKTGASGITGEVTLSSGKTAITFGKLTFTAPGTYHYLVSEVNGGQTGVTYTETKYLVTIVVKDNGAGALVQDGETDVKVWDETADAFVAYTGTMLFTNEYPPLSTSVTFEGTKELTGRDLKDGEFSFVVTENGNVVSTGTNDAEGKIIFKPITYTEAGTYTYTVSELMGNLSGVTYATDFYTVIVVVEDVNGQLTVKSITGADNIAFVNTFVPDEVAVTLVANKVLTGADLTAGQFSFVVKDSGGNQVASGTNDADGKITFSKIEYFLEDLGGASSKTFTYTITEVKPDSGVDPSMYYDDLVITATVVVTYDSTSGTLSVREPAYTYSKAGQTGFMNVDNADTISVVPNALKIIEGNMPENARFSFSVTDMDGKMVTSGISGALDNNGNAPVTFSAITYDYDDLEKNQQGEYVTTTFRYWITEDQGGSVHAGIHYSADKYLMVVTIGIDDQNALTKVVKYYALKENGDADNQADYTVELGSDAVPTFTNTYAVTTGTSVTMEVKKDLVNRELKAGEFTFGLYHLHGGQETLVATATNDINGLVTFTRAYAPSVLDTHGNEIHYVIRELSGNVAGVTYDERVVYVKVVVADDGYGNMTAVVTYYSDKEMTTKVAAPTFTNTYTPADAEVILSASKVLTGGTLQAGQFSFVVLDAQGNEVAWATNDANGSITFSKLVYDLDDAGKTFNYTVQEVVPDIGADPSLYYDPTTYTVTVTVTYDRETGALTAAVTSIIKDNAAVNGISFTNIDNPDTISVTPEGFKTITAPDDVEIPDGLKFSFRVRYMGTDPANLDQNGPVVATGVSQGQTNTNDAIDFTELVFGYDDVDQTFYYLIEEVNVAANGITYTTEQYVMVVTINKDSDTNELDPSIEYRKVTGIDADGKLVLSDIQKEQVVFNNTVNEVIKRLDIQGTKNMVGKTLHGGEFDFRLQLLKADGTLADSIVDGVNAADNDGNDATTTIKFGSLIFSTQQVYLDQATKVSTTDDGLTKVYEYHVLISEIEPAVNAIPGVTYSTQKYIAVIRWEAAANGTSIDYDDPYVAEIYTASGENGVYTKTGSNLLAGVDFSNLEAVDAAVKNALTFSNTYAVQTGTSVTLEVKKDLVNRELKAGEFEFGLYHNGNLVALTTNGVDLNNDGQITGEELGVVRFTRTYAPTLTPGLIEYHIEELNNNLGGVAYDDRTIYAKVTVTDENSSLQASTPQYSYSVNEGYAETILTFTNTYTPDPVEVTLSATKELTGRDLVAEEFDFVVLDAVGKEVAWGTNDVDGNITFSKLTYGLEDVGTTFTYTVKEAKPDIAADPSLYYDPAEFEVTVTVSYSEATGELSYVIAYPDDMEFNNIDNPDTIAVTPVGTKTTQEISGKIPAGTTFSFTVYELVDGGKVAVGAGTSGDGTGENGSSITFSTLIYDFEDVGKTFTYEIVEDNAGTTHAGITYDSVVYKMIVVIGMENNALTKTVTYTDKDNNPIEKPVFSNTYKITQPATVTIKADKVLTGRVLRANEFGFNLYHIHNGEENLVATTTNGADGAIVFSRTYDPSILLGEHGAADHKSATIYYVIREQVNNLGGVDYSQANPVYVKVTITANDNGTMTPVATYYSDDTFTTEISDPTFTNKYDTTDTVFKPVVYKVLNGRDMLDDEFSFVVKDKEGNPVSYGLSKAARSGEASVIVFGDIVYTLADAGKIFVYEISEIKGNLVNVGYTDAKIYLKVEVKDNENGTLSTSGVYYSDKDCTKVLTNPTFTNTYTPIGTTVTLEATKTLTGREMVDGEFSFQVLDANGKVVATGGNVGGAVKFSGIGITAEMMGDALTKDFVFTMVELKTNQGGVTFDPSIYYAKVTVTNNPATGKLEHSVTYYSDADCQNQLGGAPRFVNEYKAETMVEIPVHKNLVNHTLTAGMFEFVMKLGDQQVADLSNDENGNAVFSLKYGVDMLADATPDANNVRTQTFTYTLSEVKGEDAHVTYDETVYTVTVTLTDDGKGTLSADVKITVAGEPVENVVFTNIFTPEPITVDLDTAIDAVKSVVDDEGNELDYKLAGFEFQVLDVNGQAVLDAEGSPIVGVSDADGKISFQNFTFAVEGEYRYLISEIAGDTAGMTYDATVWCVHIQVRYNPDTGILSVSNDDVYTHILTAAGHAADGIQAQAEENPVFVNVYDADDVSLHLTLDKSITGDRTTVKEHEFLFHLLNADGTIAGEARNHHDGTVNFYLYYDLQDLKGQPSRDFVYTVKEVIPQGVDNGITYDDAVYTITVTLKDDGNGALITLLDGEEVSGTVDTGIAFVNRYTAADVDLTIQAIKRMEGKLLGEGLYTFLLQDGETVVATGTNKADGTIVFDQKLTFTAPGTYTYTMVEAEGTLPGVTYDESCFKLTVTVTDNGMGKLEAAAVWTIGETAVDLPIFTNLYSATDSNEIVIGGTKILENLTLKAEMYQFLLKDSAGSVLQTVTHDSEGKFVFDGMIYSFGHLEGETSKVFTYTVSEVQGSQGGVTYDKTVYTVEVTVTDNGDGTLTAVAAVTGGKNDGKIVFTNTYHAGTASVDVTAKKELTGKTLTEGEFSFVLVNKANKDEQYTASNKADGSIVFQNLTFSAAGTYVYELSEVKGTDGHITYDDTVYTVTITVVDNGDGTMSATAAYDKTPVFRNVHTPDDIVVVLEGTKELTGRDLVDGEFDFEVRDDKGNLVTTGTNKADGTIVFQQMVIGSELELILKVSEVKGTDRQIEYDDYVYRVKLTVTNDNGVLKADVEYLDGEIVFYNEYEIPVTPNTGDDTPIHLYMGMMLTSAVALLAVLVLGREKKERKFF